MHTKRNMLLLVLTSMIWGVAFVFQTTGGNAVGPYTFSCLRSVTAFIALIPVIRLLDHLGLTSHRPQSKQDWQTLIRGGVLCGLALAGTSIFQQLGLFLGTSAGKAGFLTACYIILVPVLGIFLHKKCGWNVWLAVGVTLVGLYLLCLSGGFTFQMSDLCVLVCSLACACHIMIIDHYTVKVDAVRLSWIQFIVAAAIAAVPMVLIDMGGNPEGLRGWAGAFAGLDAWIPLLYAGLLSSAVGYTLQCVGQQDVNPTIATLLMSMESVFSALAGWVMLNQSLSPRELAGCVLIFAAVIFAQIPPETFRRKKA